MARPSLGAAAGICGGAGAVFFGLTPLSDNSFFTHLATGRVIVDTGHVPRSDPYTFTAHGVDWVVQSWLASALYGLVDEVAGINGLRILLGLLTLAVFAVVWRLARPAQGVIVRLSIAALCLGIGAGQWSERPLLFGLIGLGLTILAAEGSLDPRWLLPVGWIWVNTHGSFPLGLAYLVVVLVGRRMDGDLWAVEARCLRWMAAGVALGAVNPLGPRILLFPLELLQRQDVLHNVIEWQAPGFRSAVDRIFLLQVMVGLLALVRRPRYRYALPFAVFVGAALLGSRNIAVASMVLVPLIASAWADVGTLRSDLRDRMASFLAVGGLAAIAVISAGQLGEADLDLDHYPILALEHLADHHVDLEAVHMAGPDRVGNLLEVRDGPGRRVFYDDRFDMFPSEVSDDALELVRGMPGAPAVLDEYEIDLVVWERSQPLATILGRDPAWRRLFDQDPEWVLLCRLGADLGGDLGSC